MGLIKEGNSILPQQAIVSIQPLSQNSNAQPLDPKSRRILVQGIIQAAAQSPVLQMFCVNPEEYHHQVKELAKVMIKFVEENS